MLSALPVAPPVNSPVAGPVAGPAQLGVLRARDPEHHSSSRIRNGSMNMFVEMARADLASSPFKKCRNVGSVLCASDILSKRQRKSGIIPVM